MTYFVQTGVVKDGIPALNQPQWVGADHPEDLWFLEDESRVIGFRVRDMPYAVPHSLLWYHEIANVTLETSGAPLDLAITYCPLTGSSTVFDRAAVGGAEFGVSGLLYKNNLVMYDRRGSESFWPQMSATAECGAALGAKLRFYPSVEMTWRAWRTRHPDTRVLGSPVGNRGPYDIYPYGDYEFLEAGFAFPMPSLDGRRPPKERVLGVIGADGSATAFPFGSLSTLAAHDAVEWTRGAGQGRAVVFWDRAALSARAYLAVLGADTLSFEGGADGITDEATGSRWDVEGVAVAGPLAGARLEPLDDAMVAFWGAWYAFYPGTELWGPGKPPPPQAVGERIAMTGTLSPG
jgi:hypothetical protein